MGYRTADGVESDVAYFSCSCVKPQTENDGQSLPKICAICKKPIRLYGKREKLEEANEELPNKAGEVRHTFLHRPPPVAKAAAPSSVAALPSGRIAKITPVAKPPGKLRL